MNNFANDSVLSIDTAIVNTIDLAELATVTGGYDLGHAVQAGNAAAGPGRDAGQTLGTGFDAGYKVVTGRDSTVGTTIGGPLGAAVGWTGGFATDTWQQLRGQPTGQPAAR